MQEGKKYQYRQKLSGTAFHCLSPCFTAFHRGSARAIAVRHNVVGEADGVRIEKHL